MLVECESCSHKPISFLELCVAMHKTVKVAVISALYASVDPIFVGIDYDVDLSIKAERTFVDFSYAISIFRHVFILFSFERSYLVRST